MDLIARIREVAEPLAHAEGVDLFGLSLAREGGRQVLRLTVEREASPTTIRDCESVSRAVERALDNLDLIPGSYTLEVSSCGLDRPLLTRHDFRKSLGRLVRLELRSRSGRALVGTLTKADENGLELTVPDGTRHRADLSDVASARREVGFGIPELQRTGGRR